MNWSLGNLNWSVLILLILGVWIIQAGMTMIQVRNYQKSLRQIVKSEIGDFIGVGSNKGWFQPGAVILMATDKTGKVMHVKKMQGITVFTRFHTWDALDKCSIYDLVDEKYPEIKMSKTCKKAVKKTAQLILNKIKEKNDELQSTAKVETEVISNQN